MSLLATALGAPRRGARLACSAAPCLAALLVACTARPSFMPGDECELNTNCAAPLVCRLGRCRVECRAQRDCSAGLECVRDEVGLGACQLPDETRCTLSSDCPPHLVCHFGRCTNECEADRDCPPGARCLTDPTGGRGCRDEATMECELTSDCPPDSGLVCAADRRCREPCREDWDCSDGRQCVPDGRINVCRHPIVAPLDAAPRDGGVDGGADTGATPTDADASPDASAHPAPPPPPRISGGLQNTCAAMPERDLHCWGANGDGQIGDGTVTPRPAPRAVSTLERPSLVGVGHGHACAPLGERLHCWGRNDRGQVGQGSTVMARYTTPVPVEGLPTGLVADVALGAQHSCVIVTGRLFCWGANDSGQLGLGDLMDRSAPTEVLGLSDEPVQVVAFSVHTCVRGASGLLECFGENGNGQLGMGGRADEPSPRPVPSMTDVLAVAAGGAHTCAIRSGGQVFCWGSDALGQAGNGGSIGAPDLLSPTATLALPSPALQIAAGSAHTCARTASAVHCWGDNFAGQCGRDPTSADVVFAPTAVAGLGALDEVALGSMHTCVRDGARLLCFGDNASGQLGLGAGAVAETWMPTPVVWP